WPCARAALRTPAAAVLRRRRHCPCSLASYNTHAEIERFTDRADQGTWPCARAALRTPAAAVLRRRRHCPCSLASYNTH
ncbi:hypothetical protein C7E12_22070, partial [Stenotrophomonas maltophilia]